MALLPAYTVHAQGTDITHAIVGCTVEENKGEIATRATISVGLRPAEDTGLVNLLVNGARIDLAMNGVAQYTPMRAVRWRFVENGDQRLIVASAYELIYALGHTEEDFVFGADLGAVDRLKLVAAKVGPEMGDTSGVPNTRLRERFYPKETPATVILQTLLQARLFSGVGGLDYYLRARSGGSGIVLDVLKPGANTGDDVHTYDAANATSVDDSWDIEDLVTQVAVVGSIYSPLAGQVTRFPDGPIDPTVIQTRHFATFGKLQALIYAADVGPGDEGNTRELAQQVAADRGEPRRVQLVRTVDDPRVRKGQAHRFRVGTLNTDHAGPSGEAARFVLTGVSRDWTTGLMEMQVDASGFLGRYVELAPLPPPSTGAGVDRVPGVN